MGGRRGGTWASRPRNKQDLHVRVHGYTTHIQVLANPEFHNLSSQLLHFTLPLIIQRHMAQNSPTDAHLLDQAESSTCTGHISLNRSTAC